MAPPAAPMGTAAGARGLPGIVEFEGPVFDASTPEPALAGSEVIACIGTDQAMVDLIPTLVDAGCRVKVFEDRARLVLPDRPGLPGALRVLGAAVGHFRRATTGVPAPAFVCQQLADEQGRLERRAGSLHRRRLLHDRWLRRQLTPSPQDDRPPLHGDRYYRVLDSGHAQLISWPIARVTASGVRTCDGLEHRVDAIVVAR